MTGESIKRNQSIYFAHPRATQGTKKANEAIEAIKNPIKSPPKSSEVVIYSLWRFLSRL